MLNIIKGPIAWPQKVVLYGTEGIGKTTLAAQCPDPLFIDTEGGSTHLDVRRLQGAKDWEALISLVREVAVTPDVCRTLVIDTADWAEQMAIAHICRKFKQDGLESFGYGKGYTFLAEEFARLLAACDEAIRGGKHVVINAHAKQRRVELPDEAGGFDVWGMKLSKQCAPLLKEWADALLFINYKTYVVMTDSNTRKAQGGKRVIYTSHSPVWDAKNRHGLPDELALSYKATLTVTIDNDQGAAMARVDLILYRTLEWKIAAFFRCIGQKKLGEKVVMDWSKVIGARGRAHFKPRTYIKNGEERQVNDVDRFLDYDPSVAFTEVKDADLPWGNGGF